LGQLFAWFVKTNWRRLVALQPNVKTNIYGLRPSPKRTNRVFANGRSASLIALPARPTLLGNNQHCTIDPG
jgi:hypothetical protein